MRAWVCDVPLHFGHRALLQIELGGLLLKTLELSFCRHKRKGQIFSVCRSKNGVCDSEVHSALPDLRLTDHLGRRLEPWQEVIYHFESGCRDGGRLLALQHITHLCLEDFDMYRSIPSRCHPAQDFRAIAVPHVHTQHKTHRESFMSQHYKSVLPSAPASAPASPAFCC